MRKVVREIDSTFSEERTYDDDGKLVEIRKIASVGTKVPGVSSIPHTPGGGLSE